MKRRRKRKKISFKRAALAVYTIVIGLMIFIVVSNMVMKEKKTSGYGLGEYGMINSLWMDTHGQQFDFKGIDKYIEDKDYIGNQKYIAAFCQVPKEIKKDQSLIFRSKNAYVTVLIGGENAYETEVAQAPFYNHSPGTRWNIVHVLKEDAGKQIELRVNMAYEDGRTKVDNFYFGDEGAILLQIIRDKAFGLFVSVIILAVGLFFIIADVLLNLKRTKKDNSLFYLGLLSVFAGVWCLLETNVFQLFTKHLRLIQVVDNMMLAIACFPFLFYMEENYGILKRRIPRLLCCFNAAYVLLATLSHMAGGLDYHQTLDIAVVTYGIECVILGYCMVQKYRTYRGGGGEEDSTLLSAKLWNHFSRSRCADRFSAFLGGRCAG